MCQLRFNETQLLIDLFHNLDEEVFRDRIIQSGNLRSAIADRSGKRCQCFPSVDNVLLVTRDSKKVRPTLNIFWWYLNCALHRCAEISSSFGDRHNKVLHFLQNLVEHFLFKNQTGSPDMPARLLNLMMQIKCGGEILLENRTRLDAAKIWQCFVCLVNVHRSIFSLTEDAQTEGALSVNSCRVKPVLPLGPLWGERRKPLLPPKHLRAVIAVDGDGHGPVFGNPDNGCFQKRLVKAKQMQQCRCFAHRDSNFAPTKPIAAAISRAVTGCSSTFSPATFTALLPCAATEP